MKKFKKKKIFFDLDFFYGNEHLHNKHKQVTWHHDYYGCQRYKKSNNLKITVLKIVKLKEKIEGLSKAHQRLIKSVRGQK